MGVPDQDVVTSTSGTGFIPGVRLGVAGHDQSQQAALGAGTQHNYFGGMPRVTEAPVSIALPAGQRDGRFPLRGRGKLLGELVAADGGPRVRVIHGMGGCGKTCLALEAAHLASQRGVEIWWVSAAERSRLVAGMQALGRRLGVTDDELRRGDAADLLWLRLSGWTREWLLVLDNADDPEVLAGPGAPVADGTGWLRPVISPAGLVLVTSREGHAGSWGPWCRLHSLGMLTTADAAQVLADRTGVHHGRLGGDAGAEPLADRLGRLPLALRIAGSFLAELAEVPPAFADPAQIDSYLRYREVLDQGDLDAAFPSRAASTLTPDLARDIIDRTWELSLDQLESRQFPEARRLMRLASCLADAPIPYELLLRPPALADSRLFADITGPRLWQVLQALADFGLIELTGVGGPDHVVPRVIQLHPLVRDTSRAGTSQSERREYFALAARLAQIAAGPKVAGSPEDPAAWLRWQTLAPHALHVFEVITLGAGYPDEVLVAAAYAADEAAAYQANQGLISTAEATHRAVLEVRLRVLGPDHPDAIGTRLYIARRLSERADYHNAEIAYENVLDAMRRTFGPNNLTTLNVQHNIAALISFRGDYSQAEARYRDVMAVKLRTLSSDHEQVLLTRHEIARMMSEQGRHAEAEAEFRSVLAERIRILGPDSYDTLITRSQVARTIGIQGEHANAEAELRDILAIQLRILGQDHLRTLWTRHQMALMMAAQGDYTGAETELREVVAKRQPRVPDHPDTLAARHELARMLAAGGRTSEARTEFQEVLAAKIRVLGPHHPSTEMTMREIESLAVSQKLSNEDTTSSRRAKNRKLTA